MITRRERAALLGAAGSLGLAVLFVLPFIQTRAAIAVAALLLAVCAFSVGVATTAPIHPNRK